LLYGTGNELIEGSTLLPLNKATKTKEGDAEKIILEGRGHFNSVVVNANYVNVTDYLCSGLKKPLFAEIHCEYFCKKYNLVNNSIMMLDKGVYYAGDVVFIAYNNQHFLCEYNNNEHGETLIDIDTNIGTKEEINFADSEIIGGVYLKIDKAYLQQRQLPYTEQQLPQWVIDKLSEQDKQIEELKKIIPPATNILYKVDKHTKRQVKKKK
jgi:hypothetical protein